MPEAFNVAYGFAHAELEGLYAYPDLQARWWAKLAAQVDLTVAGYGAQPVTPWDWWVVTDIDRGGVWIRGRCHADKVEPDDDAVMAALERIADLESSNA